MWLVKSLERGRRYIVAAAGTAWFSWRNNFNFSSNLVQRPQRQFVLFYFILSRNHDKYVNHVSVIIVRWNRTMSVTFSHYGSRTWCSRLRVAHVTCLYNTLLSFRNRLVFVGGGKPENFPLTGSDLPSHWFVWKFRGMERGGEGKG